MLLVVIIARTLGRAGQETLTGLCQRTASFRLARRTRPPQRRGAPCIDLPPPPDRKFADSPLEGEGFELLVARHKSRGFLLADRNMDKRVPIAPAGLDQHHANGRVFGETVGQHASVATTSRDCSLRQ